MQNVIFPIFYKGFSKSNLTENMRKHLFTCALANLNGFQCMGLCVSLFGLALLNFKFVFVFTPMEKLLKENKTT
jgi:hypothetical protein